MFNPKSDYALNKGDETSIVYQDANGAITRLTVNDFASAAEFQRWKDWMDMEHHIEEKQDHIYRNHTVCFQGYEDPTHSVADEAAAWEQQEAGQRQEQAHRDLLLQVRSVLTETQYRRAWMYYAEGKDTYEIAQIEGTCHQAISQSLNAAQKRFFVSLKRHRQNSITPAIYEGLLRNPSLNLEN